jgi:hypothetical protein
MDPVRLVYPLGQEHTVQDATTFKAEAPAAVALAVSAEPSAVLSKVQLDTFRHQIAAFSHLCQMNVLITQQQAEERGEKLTGAYPVVRAVYLPKPEPIRAAVVSQPQPQPQQQQQQQGGQLTLAAIAASIAAGTPGMAQSANSQPCYPAPIYSKDNKTPSAPRWNPTPTQLVVLEKLFSTGMGTPNGELRTSITQDLKGMGHVNEANVYNWFQNKKARMKKKAQDDAAAGGGGGGGSPL